MADDESSADPQSDGKRQLTPSSPESQERMIRRVVEEVLARTLERTSDSEGHGRLTETHTITETSVEQSMFIGPIPSPEAMEQYKAIDPTLPQQIMDRSNREQAFRHEMVREEVSQNRDAVHDADTARSRGQWFAFIIAMAAIIAGALCGQALAAIIASLVSLLGLFIASKVIERWPAITDQNSDDADQSQPPSSAGEPTRSP